MSVYVGIDVHRKRSQIAVLDQDGTVRINRNVPNGVGPVLGVIGDLPIGTPVAFEAAYGWGWLVELLEDYGYQPHLVHPLSSPGPRTTVMAPTTPARRRMGACEPHADHGIPGASPTRTTRRRP